MSHNFNSASLPSGIHLAPEHLAAIGQSLISIRLVPSISILYLRYSLSLLLVRYKVEPANRSQCYLPCACTPPSLDKMVGALIPGHSRGLEMQVLGTILSSMTFSISILLGILCLISLERKKRQHNIPRYLPAYVVLVLILSTFSMVEGILSLLCFLFREFEFYRLNSGAPISLPLTIWAADGFMLWRCAVLYQGISRKRRILLISLLWFLGMKSFALGILALTPFLGFLGTIILIALTTSVNLIVVTLILFRLAVLQSYMRKVLGVEEYPSPYSIIMNMCVESAALIVVIGISCVIAAISDPGNADAIQVPMLIMPQICVISPLLIVYRVGQGRAAIETDASGKLESLKFVSNQLSEPALSVIT